MDLGLKDERVLITGGTKSIGRAIVDAFVAEGAIVGLCARDAALRWAAWAHRKKSRPASPSLPAHRSRS